MQSEFLKLQIEQIELLARHGQDEEINFESPHTVHMARCTKIGPEPVHFGINKSENVRVGILRKKRTIGKQSFIDSCMFIGGGYTQDTPIGKVGFGTS